jgi:hypothetical protein
VSSKPHEPDLKNIWQNQETKEAVMSIEEVRLNAQRFLRRKQLDLIARTGFVVLAAVFCGLFLMNARITSLRAIAGLVMTILLTSTVWSLLRAYRIFRGRWSLIPAGPNVAMTSCLEFYRNELESQREYARQPAWQLATALLIIGWLIRDALMRNSTDPFRIVLPYVLFAAAGMIVLTIVRKLQALRFQDDITALDVFEDEILAGGSHDTTVDEHKK